MEKNIKKIKDLKHLEQILKESRESTRRAEEDILREQAELAKAEGQPVGMNEGENENLKIKKFPPELLEEKIGSVLASYGNIYSLKVSGSGNKIFLTTEISVKGTFSTLAHDIEIFLEIVNGEIVATNIRGGSYPINTVKSVINDLRREIERDAGEKIKNLEIVNGVLVADFAEKQAKPVAPSKPIPAPEQVPFPDDMGDIENPAPKEIITLASAKEPEIIYSAIEEPKSEDTIPTPPEKALPIIDAANISSAPIIDSVFQNPAERKWDDVRRIRRPDDTVRINRSESEPEPPSQETSQKERLAREIESEEAELEEIELELSRIRALKNMGTNKKIEAAEIETFSIDFIKERIMALLTKSKNIKEVEDLDIKGRGDELALSTTVIAKKGIATPTVGINAVLGNKDGKVLVKNYNVNANWMIKTAVEAMIVPKLNEVSEILKSYIESEKKKRVEKIWIEGGALKVSYRK